MVACITTLVISLLICSGMSYAFLEASSEKIIRCAQYAANISTTIPSREQLFLHSKSTTGSYSEEELITIIDTILAAYLPQEELDNGLYLQLSKGALNNRLKQFKVSGYSLAHHQDFAFVVGEIHTDFEVTYKNMQGESKKRKFTLNMPTTGFKFDMGYQIDLILLTNCNAFNFYETNKVITMERGFRIDITLPFLQFAKTHPQPRFTWNEPTTTHYVPLTLGITYAPFRDMEGGIIIINLGFHIFGNYNDKWVFIFYDCSNINKCPKLFGLNLIEGLSIVDEGATLTPHP